MLLDLLVTNKRTHIHISTPNVFINALFRYIFDPPLEGHCSNMGVTAGTEVTRASDDSERRTHQYSNG